MLRARGAACQRTSPPPATAMPRARRQASLLCLRAGLTQTTSCACSQCRKAAQTKNSWLYLLSSPDRTGAPAHLLSLRPRHQCSAAGYTEVEMLSQRGNALTGKVHSLAELAGDLPEGHPVVVVGVAQQAHHPHHRVARIGVVLRADGRHRALHHLGAQQGRSARSVASRAAASTAQRSAGCAWGTGAATWRERGACGSCTREAPAGWLARDVQFAMAQAQACAGSRIGSPHDGGESLLPPGSSRRR